MSILWTLLIGFVIGLVARMLKPGRDVSGFVLTTVLGIAGAFVGTYIGQTMGFYAPGQPAGFVMSVVGAIILLVIWGIATRRR